jgi:RHS repeat-associated protein
MKTAIMAGSTMSHRQTTGRKRRVLLWMMGLVLAWAAVCAHAGNTVTTVTLVMTDTQGNVLMTKDPQGHILARYTYRPYGTQQSGPTNAGPGYTGHVNDPGSGLVYMQQRYYDPGVGRFLSPDPIGPAAGNAFNFNRYAYANDNPVVNIDPDGRASVGENIDQNAMAAAKSGNHFKLYAWALAGVAWNVLGAESVSQVADKGAAASTSDKVMAVVTIVTLGKGEDAVTAVKDTVKGGEDVAKDVIHVTKEGVALPAESKYKIPEKYVQNPHRSGSYGEIKNGKFKERLRIDPETPKGKKGPDYSHYHKDGRGQHYSPLPKDKDPGFGE